MYICSVPYAYLYHTGMVHTIHVYVFGTTIRICYGLLYGAYGATETTGVYS